MINRVLIRVKVVQMLYSFMLSQSEFHLMPEPDAEASRDKKFAYGVYSRMLWLIPSISGIATGTKSIYNTAAVKSLRESTLPRMLGSNDAIRTMVRRLADSMKAIEPLLPKLSSIVTSSGAYRSYTHTANRGLADDVRLWSLMLKVIADDADFIETLRSDADFTLIGLKNGVDAAIATLRGIADTRSVVARAEADLQKSLDQAYLLYNSLLCLPLSLVAEQERRLENARNKYLPTDADLNPNLRFVENKFVKAIGTSERLDNFFADNPFKWDDDPVFVRSLLDRITASQAYAEYMADGREPSFADDAELWRKLFKTVILPGDDLAEMLESKSVYWNDDIEIIGTFVLKTIKRIASDEHFDDHILPQFKDDEDAKFGAELFRSAVEHRDEYRAMIDSFILDHNSWDPERLALMDIVIMLAAITEIVDFPQIPIPVTLNEYIEIANSYSTPRSGQFINGILYSVVNKLKEEHIINKE